MFVFGLLPTLVQDAVFEIMVCVGLNGLFLALVALAAVSAGAAVAVAIVLIAVILLRESILDGLQFWRQRKLEKEQTQNMFYSVEDDQFVVKDRNVDFGSLDTSKFIAVGSPVGRSATRMAADLLFGRKGAVGAAGGTNNTIMLGGGNGADDGDNPYLRFPGAVESAQGDSFVLGGGGGVQVAPAPFVLNTDPAPGHAAAAVGGAAGARTDQIQFQFNPSQSMTTMSMTTYDRASAVPISGPPIPSQIKRPINATQAAERALSPGSPGDARNGSGSDEERQQTTKSRSFVAPRHQIQSIQDPIKAPAGGIGGDDESQASNASRFSKTRAKKARSIERGRRLRSLVSTPLEDDYSLPSFDTLDPKDRVSSRRHHKTDHKADRSDRARSSSREGGSRSRAAAYQPTASVGSGDQQEGKSDVEEDYPYRRRKKASHQSGPGSRPNPSLGFSNLNPSASNYLEASAEGNPPFQMVEVASPAPIDRIPPPKDGVVSTPAAAASIVAPPSAEGESGGASVDSKYPMFF